MIVIVGTSWLHLTSWWYTIYTYLDPSFGFYLFVYYVCDGFVFFFLLFCSSHKMLNTTNRKQIGNITTTTLHSAFLFVRISFSLYRQYIPFVPSIRSLPSIPFHRNAFCSHHSLRIWTVDKQTKNNNKKQWTTTKKPRKLFNIRSTHSNQWTSKEQQTTTKAIHRLNKKFIHLIRIGLLCIT